MPDRTEREKLVEALADLVVQELADSLPSGRAEGAAALLNGTEYEDLYVVEDEEIRAAVRLAAADLLSEEGEPDTKPGAGLAGGTGPGGGATRPAERGRAAAMEALHRPSRPARGGVMSPHQWNPWHGVPRDVLDEGQEDGRTKHDGTQDAAGRPQDPDDPNDPYLEGLPVSTNRYLAQAARIEALEEQYAELNRVCTVARDVIAERDRRVEALEEALRRLVNACTMPGLIVGKVTSYTTRKPEQEVVEAARRTLPSTTEEEDDGK